MYVIIEHFFWICFLHFVLQFFELWKSISPIESCNSLTAALQSYWFPKNWDKIKSLPFILLFFLPIVFQLHACFVVQS